MRTFTNVISLAAWRQRSVWSWGRRTERQAVRQGQTLSRSFEVNKRGVGMSYKEL